MPGMPSVDEAAAGAGLGLRWAACGQGGRGRRLRGAFPAGGASRLINPTSLPRLTV